jgi:methylated-DNA-[protein]-cysteine S-methyltransferase
MPQLSLHTPLGEVTISEDGGAIVALDWGRGRDQEATPLLREACDQLQDYFDGKRMSFNLPLAPEGSDFQKRVWAALCAIPPGETQADRWLQRFDKIWHGDARMMLREAAI